ncbi:response regulator transcription factor [Nocardioides sp. cx-173]|uniref:response regulator n=1 Tax=Nocardioides sp. cx-173 TaxID=2898796 RepID=UPI001E31FA63|nr:response regulator transcription factor [Nocardioides sp. cx-173]MCD4527040.1 response regulator transcription factor [Nocardioides sp. cx-173]UGB41028.1 response regulator transcription factor [Nocardioides sp. cx-173]
MTSSVRVLVVDDDPLVRSALGLMLGGQADVEVVGEAADGRAGVALARELRPDVVLMDIRMPRLNGLDATQALRADASPPRVIVLTTFDADEHVLGAVAAGADGFLLKDTPPVQILDAIRTVAAGEPILSPSATRTLIDRVRTQSGDGRAAEAQQRLALLTDRERDVALAVGRGLSNAEIATCLHLSVPTVKAHVSRLFEKLGTTNRVQIAICVHDAGLS